MASTQTIACVTIEERINRIRLRARLEKFSNISVARREEFLAFCQQYEQMVYSLGNRSGKDVSVLDGCGTEQDASWSAWQENQIHWNPFGDWNNYAPGSRLRPCTPSSL